MAIQANSIAADSNAQAALAFLPELKRLAQFIQNAKQDIAAIHPKAINTDHIPLANDELDAVVGATEAATNKIMDVCDDITRIAEAVPPEFKERLINCTTQIYEACNFQDITGQRITKVVAVLKHIDGKVGALLAALGDELGPVKIADNAMTPPTAPDSAAGLLNGPQLPGQGVDQDHIDRLLEKH